MTVSGHDWSHPRSYTEAKSRLVGRQKLNMERKRFAGQVCDEVVWPLLLRYGMFEWSVCSRIAKEIGVSRATACRYRQRIFKAMLGL